MPKAPAFQFYPKQWLGDDKVMAMSWDARAMHMHLICIAWQQEPPCTLPDDDAMIRQWLGNPRNWESLKIQIFRAWKKDDGRWVQAGLLAQFNRQATYAATRKRAANIRWGNDAYASANGCITDALQSSSSTTKLNPPLPPVNGGHHRRRGRVEPGTDRTPLPEDRLAEMERNSAALGEANKRKGLTQ